LWTETKILATAAARPRALRNSITDGQPVRRAPTMHNVSSTWPQAESSLPRLARVGNLRWAICALLFAATSINYTDRQILAVLAPLLQHVIGWNERQYGFIVAGFQTAYAIGMLGAGRFVDRFGTKIGYAVVISVWSLAAMSHSLAGSILGFGIARFALGLGESGNFPAAIKTVAEWFPRRERALATGIFNAGSNLGAIIAPLVVPLLTDRFGWRSAFLFTGVLSACWLVAWLLIYELPEKHGRLSPAELAHIRSDQEEPAVPARWASLFAYRQTWAYALGKMLTDPVWWFYLYWLPKFLSHTYGLRLSGLGLPLVAIYIASDFGSVGGGALPGLFIRLGQPAWRARKLAMLLCASCAVPVFFASSVGSLWPAVAIIGLAAAAHQGWSANLYTTASDMFPRGAVGAVTGIGGTAGAIGGVFFSLVIGFILQWTGRYWPIFALAASLYLIGWAVLYGIVPRLSPAPISETRPIS
jgi:ACS family hexuronate transporter-like MFS transporter